ncbi:MAG: RluA family pseudouridine synthase [Candidatus Saccharimonadales bacterium]
MTSPVTVPEGAAGERLDVYLAAALELPRAQAQKLIAARLITVNGKFERSSYAVQAGDQVIRLEPPTPAAPAQAPDLEVVYEDKDILVVTKPAGLAVHPGAASHVTATVADFARPRTTDEDGDRPGIVHRLDRDTSGLLIIAKTAPAKAFMQAAFKNRHIQKTYELLVVGHVDQEEAVIKLPLGRDPAKPLQQAVSAGGRLAVTPYKVARYYNGYTHVIAHPETGRTHQLRVHFAALGHPVAGDISYGPPKRPLGLKRQFLHATALTFTAPSGQTVNLHSPLPPELQTVLEHLETLETAK